MNDPRTIVEIIDQEIKELQEQGFGDHIDGDWALNRYHELLAERDAADVDDYWDEYVTDDVDEQ